MCAARSTWSRRHRQQGSAAKRYNRRLAGLDGVNVRGAVVLAETPGSLTIVTLAGNPSPVDLLHLRDQFGILSFNRSDFKDAKDK